MGPRAVLVIQQETAAITVANCTAHQAVALPAHLWSPFLLPSCIVVAEGAVAPPTKF